MSPPLALIGSLPPNSITPSSIALHDSPGLVRPKWSIAMYSEVVKQSWVSIPCTFQTSGSPARWKASRIARRVCGKTYGFPLLSAILVSNFIGAVRCPQPRMRGNCSSFSPRSVAYLRAKASEARPVPRMSNNTNMPPSGGMTRQFGASARMCESNPARLR